MYVTHLEQHSSRVCTFFLAAPYSASTIATGNVMCHKGHVERLFLFCRHTLYRINRVLLRCRLYPGSLTFTTAASSTWKSRAFKILDQIILLLELESLCFSRAFLGERGSRQSGVRGGQHTPRQDTHGAAGTTVSSSHQRILTPESFPLLHISHHFHTKFDFQTPYTVENTTSDN
jgi:hypothetical protein